jgi:DNA-binding NarL/FixJ family response regulator
VTGPEAREPGAPIRVVLADDQAMLRDAFRVLIDFEPDMSVVGEAPDGERALAVVRAERPDVVLMDIRMPGSDGLWATRAISADPDLAGVSVLVLTTFEADEYVAAALRAGAAGFLGKGAEPADLLSAIRTVAAGDALLSPSATRSLIAQFLATRESAPRNAPVDGGAAPVNGATARTPDPLAALTVREREVLTQVAAGLPNDRIAERLGVSPLTVKTHVNRTMAKLGARDRAQLVVAAYESGLVRPATG